jgi:hypothetical protein
MFGAPSGAEANGFEPVDPDKQSQFSMIPDLSPSPAQARAEQQGLVPTDVPPIAVAVLPDDRVMLKPTEIATAEAAPPQATVQTAPVSQLEQGQPPRPPAPAVPPPAVTTTPPIGAFPSRLSAAEREQRLKEVGKCEGSALPRGRRARRNEIAKRRKEMDKAREEYLNDLKKEQKKSGGFPSECLAGGTPSKYNGDIDNDSASKLRGKCDAKACSAGPDAGKSGMFQCNAMVFCSADGEPVCASLSQNFFAACWKKSFLDKNGKAITKREQSCKYVNSIAGTKDLPPPKQLYKEMDDVVGKVCGRAGSDKLFCYECSELRYAIDDAADLYDRQSGVRNPTTETVR